MDESTTNMVTNVFLFAPKGTIICCAINEPECMYDSKVCDWGVIYKQIEGHQESHGQKVVLECAFFTKDSTFLITSAKEEYIEAGATEALRLRQARSLHQYYEWWIRAFQSSFPLVKDHFIYKQNVERGVILFCAVGIFNLRTRTVRIDQIIPTYIKNFGAGANNFYETLLGFRNRFQKVY